VTPVLIPIINGKELTRNCIKSVLAQDVPCEVFVLDNGATDGSGEMLRAWADDRIHYIAARKPSVAASWNFGLKWLFAQGHAAVLVLNNDTELRPDTVRWLLADGGPFVTAVGAVEKEKIRPQIGGSYKGREDASWVDGDHWLASPDASAKRPHPDFSCFLIRKVCYEQVGPFDEGFDGAYCEDSDYHVRMMQAGITAEALELPFWHLGAGTIKNDPSEATPIQQAADRNRKRFKEKYGVEVGSPQYYALFGHGEPQ